MLSACGKKADMPKAPPVVIPPFSEASLHAKLERLLAAFETRSPGTGANLNAGLAEADIRRLSSWFPLPLPPEVVSLYKWRNGYMAPRDSTQLPFTFRDSAFLPMESAQWQYASMMSTYGADSLSKTQLEACFPIAGLDGGWLVVPCRPNLFRADLQTPVVSVFQGISVFFFSMEIMVETCIDWVSHPKNSGLRMPESVEMEIWDKHNPGLFR